MNSTERSVLLDIIHLNNASWPCAVEINLKKLKLEKPKSHNHTRVPKQTACQPTKTTRKEHGYIGSFLKIPESFIPEVSAFLKEKELLQKATLLLDNALLIQERAY